MQICHRWITSSLQKSSLHGVQLKFSKMIIRKTVVYTCLLVSASIVAGDILTSPIVTNWGIWGPWEYCPDNTKVIGFQLKTEPWHSWSSLVDDTCLNAIRLICGFPSPTGPGQPVTTITSTQGEWGEWGAMFWCDGHSYAQGFKTKAEEEDKNVDETATNNLRILCHGASDGFIEGDGERWGEWTTPRICGAHQYICGLQTQVEPSQGIFVDDTSLNNIRMKCCDLSSDDLILYGLQDNPLVYNDSLPQIA